MFRCKKQQDLGFARTLPFQNPVVSFGSLFDVITGLLLRAYCHIPQLLSFLLPWLSCVISPRYGFRAYGRIHKWVGAILRLCTILCIFES
jgi:hypothetical protein